MFWLVPALISPLLWAASNVVDEHLVTRAEQAPVTVGASQPQRDVRIARRGTTGAAFENHEVP
jgi:hypothetical protein